MWLTLAAVLQCNISYFIRGIVCSVAIIVTHTGHGYLGQAVAALCGLQVVGLETCETRSRTAAQRAARIAPGAVTAVTVTVGTLLLHLLLAFIAMVGYRCFM